MSVNMSSRRGIFAVAEMRSSTPKLSLRTFSASGMCFAGRAWSSISGPTPLTVDFTLDGRCLGELLDAMVVVAE